MTQDFNESSFDALCFVGVNWGAAGDRRGTRPNGSRKFLIIIDIKILNETIAITRDTHNRDSDVIGAAGLAAGPKGRGNSKKTTELNGAWQASILCSIEAAAEGGGG